MREIKLRNNFPLIGTGCCLILVFNTPVPYLRLLHITYSVLPELQHKQINLSVFFYHQPVFCFQSVLVISFCGIGYQFIFGKNTLFSSVFTSYV